ncbi:MAG: hypothetical protein J5601_03585, partial [Elusimicrobiaceae bacterium]|nr:hypothetical protein [Elusimicrobiaceae bacterium]
MSKRTHQPENIYSSACIQALEEQYCSSCSAAVVSSCCVSSHGLGYRVVSRIYDGGRRAVYTATVGAMLANNMALPAYADGEHVVVSAGQTSTGLVMPNGNGAYVIQVKGGTTSNTVLESTGPAISQRGVESVYLGGKAYGTTVNSGTTQTVTREDANDSKGGSAYNTVINGGTQYVYAGITSGTVINSGGRQTVNASNGASVTVYSTTINSGVKNIGGSAKASNTSVFADG